MLIFGLETMTAETFIEQKLNELKNPSGIDMVSDPDELKAEIFRLLMSKKFRKYATNPEYFDHIKNAISLCVDKDEPIKLTLVFGAYKLWRFPESPEVDWAELFSLMYYSHWLKLICEIYKPGVWFDFFSDDVILELMDNIPKADTEKYAEGFKDLIQFLKPYIPANLSLTYNRVGDQYESYEAFKTELEQSKQNVLEKLGGLPKLNDEQRTLVELNVKPYDGQTDDKQWREKVFLIHEGYAQISKRRPYYRTPEKIFVITKQMKDSIAVGTTKHSVAKFWCGVGVLEKADEGFRMLVLSPKQTEDKKFKYQEMNIPGLTGKNFTKIRTIE
jgi:hypothetical protein